MTTNLTRINNNQISAASTGNSYLGINAASRVQSYSITSTLLANNLTYGSDLTITGNLTVSGTIIANGNITGGGISLDTHVHSDPQGGNTGGPH